MTAALALLLLTFHSASSLALKSHGICFHSQEHRFRSNFNFTVTAPGIFNKYCCGSKPIQDQVKCFDMADPKAASTTLMSISDDDNDDDDCEFQFKEVGSDDNNETCQAPRIRKMKLKVEKPRLPKTRHRVSVDFEKPIHSISKKYLSVAIGATLTQKLGKRERMFDTESERLLTLASALAPCGVRMGGTRMCLQVFSPNGKRDNLMPMETVTSWEEAFSAQFWGGKMGKKNWQHFLMTGHQWEKLSTFIHKAGWELLYDFNNLLFTKDGHWDSTNASIFLDYSAERNISIPAFQLGNEPNSSGFKFGKGYAAGDLARDVKLLRELLNEYPQYRNSDIVGPEVTQKGIPNYFRDFLEEGGKDVVDYTSFHHYYGDGKVATVEECINVAVLDQYKGVVIRASELTELHAPGKGLYVTETSSFHGGGAPEVSDRYAAGFLWLDKLGLSAKAKAERVYRQSFFGGAYALISPFDYEPHPDYFLSVLFKRLVEGSVFDVNFTPPNENLRLYANRARTDSIYGYPEGSLVIYYVNIQEMKARLALPQFQSKRLDLFLLTPGEGGLASPTVLLNGRELLMNGNELPPMDPLPYIGNVTLPGLSFGFIVIPDAYEMASCYDAMRRLFSQCCI